jgi:hypothetical protein
MLKWVQLGAMAAVVAGLSVAQAQEREWSLDATDEDAFLVFGVTGTDDIGVSFWCKISTKTVTLFSPLPGSSTTPPAQLTLGVAGESFQLVPEPAGELALQSVEAKLVPQQAILDKLQSADTFSLEMAGHTSTFPLGGADIEGLLRLCNHDGEQAP